MPDVKEDQVRVEGIHKNALLDTPPSAASSSTVKSPVGEYMESAHE
jgi:hypothetical protein